MTWNPEILVLTSCVVALVFRGILTKKPGWFTWHMFTYYSLTEADLVDTDGNKINLWDYLPHTQLYLPPSELQYLLYYLQKKNIIVSWIVKVNENGKIIKFTIKNNAII